MRTIIETPPEGEGLVASIAMAKRQIELLTGSPVTPIHFRLIHDTEDRAEKLYGSVDELWPLMMAKQREGYGVFFVVNEGGDRDEGITGTRAVFVDADDKPEPAPTKWHQFPSFKVRRSPTRWHGYWVVRGLPVADFRSAQYRLAAHYGTDTMVCNPSRVMRLAGTLHLKNPSQPFLVELSEDDTCAWDLGGPYSAHEITNGLPELVVKRRAPSPATGEPVTREQLVDRLKCINPDCEYGIWRDVVAAIHATNLTGDETGDERREIAHDWSDGTYSDGPSRKYVVAHVDTVFYDMPPREGGVSFGTIDYHARKAGFAGPSAAPRPSASEVFSKYAVGPFDIFGELTPPPVLTRDMLPPVIADFAFDTAERMGIDPSMAAIPALIVCAAAIHDDVTIQPQAHDDTWLESARLWSAMVGGPSIKKTPSLRASVSAIEAVEARWRKEDAADFAKYEIEKKRRAKAKDEAPECENPKPRERRLVVDDFTLEKAAYILADNPGGILVWSDELAGFIGRFDAYKSGAGSDQAAACRLYNGGPYRRDRVREGASVYVPNWSACMLGGIQPEMMHKIARGLATDGFCQRFLPFYARKVGKPVDRKPDAEAIGSFTGLVARIAGLPVASMRASPSRCPLRLKSGASMWRPSPRRLRSYRPRQGIWRPI